MELWDEFGILFVSKEEWTKHRKDIPTIETLYKAVQAMQVSHEKKNYTTLGKAKSRFLDFTERMNDYSYLADLIPSGDKYVSLVAGTVSLIVKVS